MTSYPAVRVELTAKECPSTQPSKTVPTSSPKKRSSNTRPSVIVLEKARNEGGRAFRTRLRTSLGEIVGTGLCVSEARLECADRKALDERVLLAQVLVTELSRLGVTRLTLGGELTSTREGRLDLAALAATFAEQSGVAVTVACT